MNFPTPTSPTRLLLVACLLILLSACGKSAYNTPLPMNNFDMYKVQEELNQLPAEDRQLVIDYMQRSNGDYLPMGMGDPDEPFTATNFREAIALQKEYVAKPSNNAPAR